MNKPTVWLETGVVIIYGACLDAAPHRHHAIQIVWSKSDSLCKLNGHDSSGLIIIGSGEEHQLKMAEGWILLIEPKSSLGQELANIIAEQPFKEICSFLPSTNIPKQDDDLTEFLSPLFEILQLKPNFLLRNYSTVADKRIQQLLVKLDLCLHGDCIKPTNWRAAEVAQQLALSESRFLHLFRQELGIAWRPYLLWRRMMCAIQALINNHSATEAAYLAGFSDSAHLSRTFKRTFGMTIRQALTLFNHH